MEKLKLMILSFVWRFLQELSNRARLTVVDRSLRGSAVDALAEAILYALADISPRSNCDDSKEN